MVNMKNIITKLGVRWMASALGLWIAASLLGNDRLSVGDNWQTVVVAGFILAVINMVLKPILVILSFPAIILTLGLFMLVVNGVIILVVSKLYDPFVVSGFGVAVVAGVIVGLVNYLVSRVLEDL
jgi:putative membrane protein